VQHAAARLLALRSTVGAAIAERVAKNRREVAASVAGSAVELLHGEGGWYAVLRLPRTRSEEAWVTALVAKERVITQPGYFFDFADEAHLVVSLLTAPEVFAEGIGRIVAHVAET
jgi:aspartate/methionine/tyrosine aminotransferase